MNTNNVFSSVTCLGPFIYMFPDQAKYGCVLTDDYGVLIKKMIGTNDWGIGIIKRMDQVISLKQ